MKANHPLLPTPCSLLPTPFVFRQAHNDDIAAIREVRASVKENVLSDPERIPPSMCAHYLNEIGRGWVCESDGEIVGFSVACLRDRSIWALFVKPGYEAQGIGKQLLKLAVDWLFAKGVCEISLTTGVGTRADRFYQQQGWQRGRLRENDEVEYRFSN